MRRVCLLLIIAAFFFIPFRAFAQYNTENSSDKSIQLSSNASKVLRGESDLSFDLTGNGIVDENDAQAVLLCAVELIDDIDSFSSSLKNSLLGEKYLDQFSYKGPIKEGNNYISDKIRITVEEHSDVIDRAPVVYYTADILIKDINCFRTAFAYSYDKKNSKHVDDMAKENHALIAISGDFFSARKLGLVIRNGVVYRDSFSTKRDCCVLYKDGTMETFLAKQGDFSYVLGKDPYQAWCFGPSLLDEEGNTKKRFNTSVADKNPRCAIGYYEPGHYCFVVVDGRKKGHSFGIDMKHLSALFYDLGCSLAYNLDGGATAVMANSRKTINHQSSTHRGCSDIIYITYQIQSETNP